jgi:hypothetical protein
MRIKETAAVIVKKHDGSLGVRLQVSDAKKIAAGLAHQGHETWRKTRKLMPDGSREPRHKPVTKDKKWLAAHPGQTTQDIANTPFHNLASDHADENKKAARTDAALIVAAHNAGANFKSKRFRDFAGDVIHEAWMKRARASGDNREDLLKPFKVLAEEQRAKNDERTNASLEALDKVLKAHNHLHLPYRSLPDNEQAQDLHHLNTAHAHLDDHVKNILASGDVSWSTHNKTWAENMKKAIRKAKSPKAKKAAKSKALKAAKANGYAESTVMKW